MAKQLGYIAIAALCHLYFIFFYFSLPLDLSSRTDRLGGYCSLFVAAASLRRDAMTCGVILFGY